MTGSKRPRRTQGEERRSPARPPDIPTDAELVTQLRAGDPRALTALVEEYIDALVRFAYYLLGSEDAAKDVVQDVFVRIWEQPGALDPTRSIKRYLYAAVRNHAFDQRKHEAVRTRHREATLAAAAVDSSLLETPSRENVILSEATVQAAIGKLSERRQEAVRLRIQEQLTHAEIGQILGISTAAAERLVQRALDDLQKILRMSG